MCTIREINSDELEVVTEADAVVAMRGALLDVAGIPLHDLYDYTGFLVAEGSVYGFVGIGPFLDREVERLV